MDLCVRHYRETVIKQDKASLEQLIERSFGPSISNLDCYCDEW